MTKASTYRLTLPGAILRRGFWLYVWQVDVPGEPEPWLYVGRTGDNSSPNASAAFTRIARHLDELGAANTLRRHIHKRGLAVEELTHNMVIYGPIFAEVERPTCRTERKQRNDELMAQHRPLRDEVGAYERDLAAALKTAGYRVFNCVNWKPIGYLSRWQQVLQAFAEHFPKLEWSA